MTLPRGSRMDRSRQPFSKLGARQAAILRAEGYAQALVQISQVATHLDSQTMSLQYLDAVKALGAATSTKLVVPAEFTNLHRPLIEHIATRVAAMAGGHSRDRSVPPS